MAIEPVLGPAACGEKDTAMLHVALTASVAGAVGQLCVAEWSEAFAPDGVTLLIVSGAVPVFLTVVVWEALVVPMGCAANVRLAGVRLIAGAVPVPARATLCGLSEALSLIWTVAVRVPVVVGEKRTEMEQVAFGPRVEGLAGQSLVQLKSEAFAPVSPIPLIVSGAAPVFLTTVDCAVLDVATRWEPNARLPGVVLTEGPAGAAL